MPNQNFIENLTQSDPEAANILIFSAQLVSSILKKRQTLDRQGLQDEPLIVLIGNAHDLPGLCVRDMLIMEGLKKNGEKIACGMERRDTFLVNNLLSQIPGIDKNVFDACFARQNNGGQLSLKHNILTGFGKSAPYSTMTLHHYLLQNRDIPVCQTDTPLQIKESNGKRIEKPFLDSNSPSNVFSMLACLKRIPENLHVSGDDGLWVRNHHSAKKILEQLNEHSPRIFLHFSGNLHILNSASSASIKGGEAIKHTLSACLADMGNTVMAVPLTSDQKTPKIIRYNGQHSADIDVIPCPSSLTNTRFFFESMENITLNDIFNSPEVDWVDTKLQRLGLGHAIIENPNQIFAHYNKEMQQELQSLKKMIEEEQFRADMGL